MHFLLAAVTAVLLPAVAAAQGPGIRGGVSIDPDQFYFGGHFETGELVDGVHFRPNVEAGLGNDLTLVGLELRVRLQVSAPQRLADLRRRRAGA